ncbi:VOC family protein [Blastococcus sp. SYSU DS1024]
MTSRSSGPHRGHVPSPTGAEPLLGTPREASGPRSAYRPRRAAASRPPRESSGLRSPERGRRGLRPDAAAPRAGGPVVLLYSADLDRTVVAVEAAGGRVTEGPYPFPGGRRFHFVDPSGNELGVWGEA